MIGCFLLSSFRPFPGVSCCYNCSSSRDGGLLHLVSADAPPASSRVSSSRRGRRRRLLPPSLESYSSQDDRGGGDGQQQRRGGWKQRLRSARGGREAEQILDEMTSKGVRLTGGHFWEALLACARRPRTADNVESILRKMEVQEGVEPNINAYNLVIDILGKRGDLERAMEIFNNVKSDGPRSMVKTYTTIVRACAKKGEVPLALSLLEGMKSDPGVEAKPDVFLYTAIIEACAHKGDAENALGVLAAMKEAGIAPNVFSYMHAVHACGLAGAHDWALVLLGDAKDELEADLQLYNAVIAACARASDGSGLERATELLVTMEEEGIAPDAVSFSSAINACANHGAQWQVALKLLDVMLERNFPPHLPAWNAMLKVLGRNSQWKAAIELLERMEQESKTNSEIVPQPNIVTYSQVMEACTVGGQPRLALDLLDKAYRVLGEDCDLVCYGVAAKACATFEDPNEGSIEALRLLSCMKSRKIVPNSIVYSSLIRALARTNIQAAKALLESMWADHRVKPNGACYTNLIAASNHEGDWEMGMNLLDDAVSAGLRLNVISWTSVIDGCAQAGQWQAALRILERMSESGVTPNHYTISTAMRACNRGGQPLKALELFEARGDVPVDEVMMSAALDACARGKQWRLALLLLKRLKSAPEMEASVAHYSSVIAACAWAGETKAATDVFRYMQKQGVAPDSLCWSLVIRSCVVAGRVHDADALIQEMEESGVQLDRERLMKKEEQ